MNSANAYMLSCYYYRALQWYMSVVFIQKSGSGLISLHSGPLVLHSGVLLRLGSCRTGSDADSPKV